jgi:hypothetical protein
MAQDNSQKYSAEFMAAASTTLFNPNEWAPTGESHPLKEIWARQYPGLYDRIEGDTAEVHFRVREDGSQAKRLLVNIKGQKEPFELPVGSRSTLLPGQEVKVSTIVGELFRKEGRKSIVRYTGDVVEDEE